MAGKGGRDRTSALAFLGLCRTVKKYASRKSTNGTVGLLLSSHHTKSVVLSGIKSFSFEVKM